MDSRATTSRWLTCVKQDWEEKRIGTGGASHWLHVPAALPLIPVTKIVRFLAGDVGGEAAHLAHLAHLSGAKSAHVVSANTTPPMRPEDQPEAPSGPWRAASVFTMGAVGLLCKGFLKGLSTVETHGMDKFLRLLDEREDPAKRERGLITGMPSKARACSGDGLGLTRSQSQTTFPCTLARHDFGLARKARDCAHAIGTEWTIQSYGAYFLLVTCSIRTICDGDSEVMIYVLRTSAFALDCASHG